MRNDRKNDIRIKRYADAESCFASMSSLTAAMRAQRILSLNAIPSNVVKAQEPDIKRGCSYRLDFSCAYEKNVRTIFDREGVKVRGFNGREI